MKKRLLNETAVRKMMKLANIEALTENFLDETNELEETQEVNEEEVNETEETVEEDTTATDRLAKLEEEIKTLRAKLEGN